MATKCLLWGSIVGITSCETPSLKEPMQVCGNSSIYFKWSEKHFRGPKVESTLIWVVMMAVCCRESEQHDVARRKRDKMMHLIVRDLSVYLLHLLSWIIVLVRLSHKYC